jgi:tyrosine aminotransferase
MDTVAGKENPEKPIISLGNGDPTLYPHLRPSEQQVGALVAAATSGQKHGYQPSQGNAASRAAIAEAFSVPGRVKPTANDVFMASGCSEALSHAIAALAAPGSNILLPRPGFPLYQVYCEYHGVEVRYYDLLPETGWQIDTGSLARLADERTCALLINNPSNPCGAVYSREHLSEVLGVAEELRLPIIADEVYAEMSFNEPFVACAAVTPNVPVMSVCSLSKRWLAPGWRVGWITVYDSEGALASAGVPETLLKLCQMSLGPSAPVQAAIPAIFDAVPSEWYSKALKALEESAQCCMRHCRSTPGLQLAVEPQGSMYCMVRLQPGVLHGIGTDDVKFAGALLEEESVVILPGQCFGAPGYFRVVYAAPPAVLDQAWARIGAFCERRAEAAAAAAAAAARAGA